MQCGSFAHGVVSRYLLPLQVSVARTKPRTLSGPRLGTAQVKLAVKGEKTVSAGGRRIFSTIHSLLP